jgi:hypothetical protein
MNKKNIVNETEIIILSPLNHTFCCELQMTYVDLGSQFNVILVLTVYLAGITFLY